MKNEQRMPVLKFKLQFALSIILALSLTGCEVEQPEIVQQIRAIKSYMVTEVAAGQQRKFSGQVFAVESASLSFQVGGNVTEMRFNQGDQIKQGDVLAVLDKQPYELDVQAAEAELEKAHVNLAQANEEFKRQNTLHKKGWASDAHVDQVRRLRDGAASQVEYATSKLNLTKRDLRLTELTAPYDGVISKKNIDAFVQVSRGQPVYDIEASGALEVRFDIPETTISRVTLGMPVTVTFPTARDMLLRARITEIGSSAGRANAFPATAALDSPPPEVRSGMTVEVAVLLKGEGTTSAYLVPLAAIAPADETRQGYVFIYDGATQTVKKTLVKGRDATDNLAHIYEGVKAGDILALSGVTFLNDGQKVKLMAQQRSTAPAVAQ